MRQTLFRFLAMLLLVPLPGCATVFNGTSEEILITSTPRGATVTVDDSVVGKTPITVAMRRTRNHTAKFELEGYVPTSTTMRRRTSGLFWLNLLWFDLAGMAVDAATGSMYGFDSTNVRVHLTKMSEVR